MKNLFCCSRCSYVMRVAVCVLLILAGVSMAVAQLPTATILGTVKDSSGAIVAGARLTAHNTDTDLTRSVISGADGSYRFDALPVGNHEARAAQTGFKTGIRSGLTLVVAQEAVVDISLEAGILPLISAAAGGDSERRVSD
jgi:hypothetical protein